MRPLNWEPVPHAPMRHMVFNNIVIKNSQYGIAFFAKDGGTFEDIRFSNILIETKTRRKLKRGQTSRLLPHFYGY